MFEPLFSTKENNIGLGLTAVFGIVKKNGGRLDVDSRPGQGTVVRVIFPAPRRPDARGTDAENHVAKGNETILLSRKTKSNVNWRCRLYNGMLSMSWKRPHRSRR